MECLFKISKTSFDDILKSHESIFLISSEKLLFELTAKNGRIISQIEDFLQSSKKNLTHC